LLGRRVHAEGQTDGEHLAGRVPVAEPRAGWVRADVAGRALPAERLRALRHGRQRLGVDRRLLLAEPPRRARARVLRTPEPAGRLAGPQLQPPRTPRPDSTPGDEGRLT